MKKHLFEADVQDLIDAGECAEDILGKHFPTAQIRLKKSCTALNKLLNEVRTKFPDAQLYLDGSDNLHLMIGGSHEGTSKESAQHHFVAATGDLKASGGDW